MELFLTCWWSAVAVAAALEVVQQLLADLQMRLPWSLQVSVQSEEMQIS